MIGMLSAMVVDVTYPPALSLVMAALGVLALALRRRRVAAGLAAAALAWSGLWSLPLASDWLRDSLEARYPLVDARSLPRADAIVVLGGGGGYGWLRWPGVSAYDLPRSRVAAGARAWLAGRAPLVILSGGGAGGRTEAQKMARAIAHLGVPRAALLLERRSRDTRDNALYTARLARERGVHTVLLVTSQLHMPRASLWFRDAGIAVVPLPVPEDVERDDWAARWLPSRRALHRSGRALKEYAGLLGAVVHQRVRPLGGAQRGPGNGKNFTPRSQAGS